MGVVGALWFGHPGPHHGKLIHDLELVMEILCYISETLDVQADESEETNAHNA